MAMPHHSLEAKRQMLAECRVYYRGNPRQLVKINEFDRNYRSADAIRWYTKPCFVYYTVNRALRTEDACALYTFRYFITDMCKHLEDTAAITRTRYVTPFRVYRGSNLSRDEVERLCASMLVATNGFLSSSKHLSVAQAFIGIDPVTGMSPSRSREDTRQYVLFNIDVDFARTPDFIVADVSDQSDIPDEHEMIFNLGTTFMITDVIYDVEHYVWNVRMISSSDVAQLSKDYTSYIRDRLNEVSARLLFGNILAEMTGDYPRALAYFHRYLRTVSVNDEDRPNIYYEIARVYRYMGKHQQSITYFRCALLLQRRRLPQWDYVYGLTLASLGTTYSELGDTARAISYHTRGMLIHRHIFPADHVDMAYHLNQLAYDHYQEEKYELALTLVSKALLLFKKGMPIDYPGHAQALHTMGIVQQALGNQDQAIDFLKQALRMRESLLAADHPFVARTCYELSILYAEKEDGVIIALEFAQRALKIRQAKLTSNNVQLNQSIQLVERLLQKKNSFAI